MTSERAWSGLLSALALVAVLCVAGPVAAETGDVLCDSGRSTSDTCVVSDTTWVAAGVLTFTAPNVRVAGTLTIQFPGLCGLDPTTPCASDADCTAPDLCARTGEVPFVVAGTFSVDPHAAVVATGQAVVGDTIGPEGGAITITAHDVTVAGSLDVSTAGITGIPAGHAGSITITADGAVAVPASGTLDASTLRGGCGGSVVVTGAAMLDAAGEIDVYGATHGGTIHLEAGSAVSIASSLDASNMSSDSRTRPACAEGKGGGQIHVEGSQVTFTGSANARGLQAAGGGIFLVGETDVTVDSHLGQVPFIVTGGDSARFTPGGIVSFSATAGNVTVRNGAIEADGVSTGAGSDAGMFTITASGTSRCWESGALCSDRADCPPGDPCLEWGGNVDVEVPLSAQGGDGFGSGCIACEIRGTGVVTVAGPVDVGGARQLGVGGKVTIAGGGDVTVGPGSVTANAGDGGSIILVAGERVGAARDIGGTLHVLNGTEILAVARRDAGFGGDIEVNGCAVDLDPGVRLTADGGQNGQPGTIDVVANGHLDIGALAALSAWPDGSITISYGSDATVAPDALFVPAASLAQDPTLTPCPACGNGAIEGLEECDGRGTCAVAGEICIPAGSPGECSCAATCGTVPGVQPGEECDADDLGGATCASQGFSGGTLACTADCTLDTSGCLPDVCGDGVAGPTEQCDGTDLHGQTCASRGFAGGGTLSCRDDCTLDTSACVDHLCGDGVVEPMEQCDPPDFAGQTCLALGFPGGGELGCHADCTLDTSACVGHLCGNGVVEPTEACDPPDFGGQMCAALGFPAGGSLACAPDCSAIVTVPHCSATVTRTCRVDGDCPTSETCVGGCRQCGNGFVDPGEECDDGPDNGSGPDHCRIDCRRPRCGDGTVDTGETCDLGDALCRGGPHDGQRCCGPADCPGGECGGGACTRNRDDMPGCCGCDCRPVPVACGNCDDGNPCTADACDPVTGCTHTPLPDGTACGAGDVCDGEESCRGGQCTAGTPLRCDDGDVCTVDACDAVAGCTHTRLGYGDAMAAVDAILFVPGCAGERVPRRIGRLLGRARTLLGRARGTGRPKAARLVARAERKLRLAFGTARRAGRRGLAPGCAGPLADVIADAMARAGCLASPAAP